MTHAYVALFLFACRVSYTISDTKSYLTQTNELSTTQEERLGCQTRVEDLIHRFVARNMYAVLLCCCLRFFHSRICSAIYSVVEEEASAEVDSSVVVEDHHDKDPEKPKISSIVST